MKYAHTTQQAVTWLALASMISSTVIAQQPVPPVPRAEATEIALPLPEDRGAAALEQSLKRLGTWASLMIIIAHPDDEDGSMLTYETRGHGVRASQLTLTRGEGGQNAISADAYDALGIIRTNELLRADQFYGVKQYWGTEADFGFSKTKEEAFAQWGHDRVLYDAVLAIRRERPLVLVSTFVGGVTDGHGQHQVSAAIEQEAYRAAGDPKVFPEQFALGVRPWSPRAVFSRMPFAPVSSKGMFDYATGKWAPMKFYNYVTQEWSDKELSTDVEIPTGSYDPVLGRSYTQIAREGWGEQKSQNGGGNPTLSDGGESEYHRWATSVQGLSGVQKSFFAGMPTGIEGLASLVSAPPDWLKSGLAGIATQVDAAQKQYVAANPEAIAPVLKAGYQATLALRQRVTSSQIPGRERDDLIAELNLKMEQFQQALTQSLGLDLQAFTTRSTSIGGGPFGGGIDETSRSVSPGDRLEVRIHTGNATKAAKLERVWLESSDGHGWTSKESAANGVANPGSDVTLEARVPEDATPTEPYFTRPSIEQPYYDVSRPEWRGRSFAPYPLTAWAEFRYEGVPIRLGEVVQTMQRQVSVGGIFEPLVVTPKIGVRVSPESRILPLDGSPLPVRVTVHTEGPADGEVRLKVPEGWTATPAEAEFHRKVFGDTAAMLFEVKPPAGLQDSSFMIQAEAESDGRKYESGWQWTGHAGLRPYNMYRKAEIKTRAVDVKVAPGLRVGYVMGTGDTVPEAMEGLGVTPHLLTSSDLMSSDLSAWDVIVLGIRAYSARPELGMVQNRLDAFVEGGGTLIVQYQSGTFPAPFSLAMGRTPERVVEESAPVKILDPQNKLLSWPNQITSHDFDGWVEERGHSFLDSWDAAYTPLTETADAGQDPQRGGLLVAHPGKGTYVYMAYAVYRQLPELVPGAYRLLANLLSAPKAGATASGSVPATGTNGR
ncbi:PIG-L family deacetylase [Acidicapsa acidisoli]|uniref:PIG-L family deacetylase n=1 Tax=Acidicapsa acidisoli TaxID=1615681 RepID=UPI0021DF87FF|nr:PIG-L family deacetylase [Acidicapsa acidisoli]